jgi:hypothetical protein
MHIDNYFFPDDLKYIFCLPDSIFWVKKDLSDENSNNLTILLGLTELNTIGFENQIKFTFRSENLPLRENKAFLRILTANKLFDIVSPWKSRFIINPEIKDDNQKFLQNPYNHWLIKCFEFADENVVLDQLSLIFNLESNIKQLIEKNIFKDCKECPDLFQSSVTRRNLKNNSEL